MLFTTVSGGIALAQVREKPSVNTRSEISVCYDMGDVRLISTADVLCGSHAFQHNFQHFVAQMCSLCLKSPVSLNFRERLSLLIAVIHLNYLSALNTPTILGVATAKDS
jgi:hypothetical protein